MVVVEGVARSFDPKLDMWSTADPVVREWITRNLGPVGKLEEAANGASQLGHFVGQMPSLLNRGGTLIDQIDDITRNGLVLSPETVSAIGKAEAQRNRWTAVALWVIAVLLAWLVWRLM
jgi:ubiquinone biosynthesis protein